MDENTRICFRNIKFPVLMHVYMTQFSGQFKENMKTCFSNVTIIVTFLTGSCHAHLAFNTTFFITWIQ